MSYPIQGSGSGAGTGAIVVADSHIFADETARDNYFASHPTELTNNVYCYITGTEDLEQYKTSTTTWAIVTPAIRGPQGEVGSFPIINTLTEKTTLVGNDLFVIEDSENSFATKKVKFSSLGGGGSTTFIGLSDVPTTYVGSGGFHVRVNSTEDALEFASGGSGTWGSISGTLSSQTDLQDALNLKVDTSDSRLSDTRVPKINELTEETQISTGDFIPIYDESLSAVRKITRNNFLDGLVSAMIYKGGINCSTYPNFPSADIGHVYMVSASGKIGGSSGPIVSVGNTLICKNNNTPSGDYVTVGSYWDIYATDEDGEVFGPGSATVIGNFAAWNNISGTLIADSGYSPSSFLTSITATGDVSGAGTSTITLTLENSGVSIGTYQSVTVDAKGRVTAGSNPTTLAGYGISDAQPLDADLTALAGLSATGFVKRTGDSTYSLDSSTYLTAVPTATVSSVGGIKVGSNLTITSDGTLSATASGSGDVIGPATNSDNYVPQWNGANSKTLKNGLAVGTSANNLVQLDSSAKLPAVDGSQLTNITGTYTHSPWSQVTAFASTPASTSTITTTSDLSGTIKAGYPLKYTIGGTTYYGIVTAITSNLITVSGPSLSGDITALYYGDPARVVQLDFLIPGYYEDATNFTMFAADLGQCIPWRQAPAYIAYASVRTRVADGSSNGTWNLVKTQGHAGTAQAGAATTITLSSRASATDDAYNNLYVAIVAGTGNGQIRQISDYVGSTKVATVSTWTTTPDSTSEYKILLGDPSGSGGLLTSPQTIAYAKEWYESGILINSSMYQLNWGSEIEIYAGKGTGGDAQDLSGVIVLVME